MKDEDDGRAGAVIAAFVIGAIAGAAVAALVVPTSGEEARRRLAEKAKDSTDRAADAARQGREFLNRQRDTVSSAVERGREAYQQARSGANPPPPAGESL